MFNRIASAAVLFVVLSALTGASWNHLAHWLGVLDGLRRPVPRVSVYESMPPSTSGAGARRPDFH